jgi:endonuclease YncB( thermonuclease family)
MKASPLSVALASAAVATSVLSTTDIPSSISAREMPFRLYKTANDIPDKAFKSNQIIHGRVEKIVDGDTFRIRHYPFSPLALRSKYDGRLSENTISIRIYALDCPETAKFGNKAQPMADEATEFTRKLVDKKVVRIKLLRRDQYNRAVAKVFVKGWLPFSKHDLTLRLAEQGYGTLYTGGGAEYDNKRDLIEKKIELAKKKKRGIWKNGSTFETPAEYKNRVKNGGAVAAKAY